jgi:hypothetical protein
MTLPFVLAELGAAVDAAVGAELGAAVDGAVGGPPAEHALSTAAAARPRIGMVRRAAFIDVLQQGQTVGPLADRSGRTE